MRALCETKNRCQRGPARVSVWILVSRYIPRSSRADVSLNVRLNTVKTTVTGDACGHELCSQLGKYHASEHTEGARLRNACDMMTPAGTPRDTRRN